MHINKNIWVNWIDARLFCDQGTTNSPCSSCLKIDGIPPPLPKEFSWRHLNWQPQKAYCRVNDQTKHINKHIWVNWMNAMHFVMIRRPKLNKKRLFEDWCKPLPPLLKKSQRRDLNRQLYKANQRVYDQIRRINKHIWVHWVNAMLFAMIRGPKFTKQRLFEDWWNPPPSPEKVFKEAPKPTAVEGKPTC